VKRALLLTTLAMVAAMVFAPVALAVTKQCSELPCLGTGRDDVLTERRGDGTNDVIRGRGGNDTIRANRFGNDKDILYGGEGRDRLNAQDGDGRDELYGGPGRDTCYVDEGDEYQGCEVVVLVIE
jgi:hypothetical protein